MLNMCVRQLTGENLRLPGIFLISGTIVHALALVQLVAKKWREAGVMAAIYYELVELSETELQGVWPNCTTLTGTKEAAG